MNTNSPMIEPGESMTSERSRIDSRIM